MSRVQRLENWPIKLSAYLADRKAMPFRWGENDCISFAAGAVAVVTGKDYMAHYRGQYHDEASAKDLLQRLGGMKKAFTDSLRVEPTRDVRQAMRGDVCTVLTNGTLAAGVIDDTGRSVAVISPTGMIKLSTAAIAHVWRY